MSLCASIVMWLANSLLPQSVAALALPMVAYSAGLGLVLPHGMAIAMRPFPHIAGTASALLGFIQMSFAAVASGVVGQLVTDSPHPMLWAMVLITSVATVLAVTLYYRYRRAGH